MFRRRRFAALPCGFAFAAFTALSLCERHGRYFCEKCACKVDALKGLKIEKFPPILTFQLKRYCRLILQLWLGPLALPSSLYVLSLEPLPAGLLSLELLPFVVTFRRTRAAV